jgi:hypothetical protein
MDVAIVYESLFGNTREIAEAIAAGVREADLGARVQLLRVADATPGKIGDADFLIVGGPTHMTRMSTQRTRHGGVQTAEKAGDQGRAGLEPGAAGPGVREWLGSLPTAQPSTHAAAFDTRPG